MSTIILDQKDMIQAIANYMAYKFGYQNNARFNIVLEYKNGTFSSRVNEYDPNKKPDNPPINKDNYSGNVIPFRRK